MTPRTHLEALFLSQGIEVIVPEHHRLLAEDDQFVWFLVEGNADLFFIELQNKDGFSRDNTTDPFGPEKLNGFLVYIHQVNPGEYLFPLHFDDRRYTHLLIRANQRCRWIKMSKETLHQVASPELKEELQRESNRWTSLFSSLFTQKGEVLEDKKEAQRLDMWSDLNAFYEDALKAHATKRAAEIDKEKNKTTTSRKITQQSLKHAFDELQSVLNLKEEYLSREERPHLMFMVCQVVANYLHLPFKPTQTHFKAHRMSDFMAKLCENVGINHREIKLKSGWWEHNIGPIIGLYGPDNKPVALLPVGLSGYQMLDVETNTTRMVDAKLDEELSMWAYVFYRPFAEKPVLSYKDVFQLALADKGAVFFKLFNFGLIATLLSLFLPFATKLLFNYVIPFSDTSILGQLFCGMVILLITSDLFVFTREWLMVYRDGKILHDIMMAMWLRIFSLPMKFFKKYEVGALIQRAFALESIHSAIAGPNLRVMLNSLFSFLYLFPMIYFSPLLTLVALIILLPIVFFSVYNIVRNYRGNLSIIQLQQQANAHVVQFLIGIAKIRTSGAENLSFVWWERIFAQIKRKQWQLQKLLNWSYVFNFTVSQSSSLFIYAVLLLALTVMNYQVNMGDFLAFMTAFGFFLPSVLSLCTTLLEVSSSAAQWKISKVFLEEPPEVDSSKVIPPALTGNIVVDRIKFRYDADAPLIFDGISFDVKPGEFVAIVGPSGCGKSTLVRLLTGFDIPESGAIYYDDKDLSTLNLRILRKQIGTVMQTTKILDGNLRLNVCGGEIYTDQEVKDALYQAGFEEDLKHLPMGLFTLISNDGATFSGGQIQRIIIARALIGKPKILIFDEATAALDNKTQAVVQSNLLKLKVTKIVIAHRLSTIMQADRILVINDGKIVENGTFDELVNLNGFFANLVNKQNIIPKKSNKGNSE